MQTHFQQHLDKNFPFLKGKKILLATSGGIDSVVLVYLSKNAGLDFAIAHCNFKLRGKESDFDEKFTKKLAEKLNVGFFAKSFDTEGFAEKEMLSIQVAARELRYNWFRELSEKENFDHVFTAHHANDSLETFLINTLRGTGLEGLTGIPEKNGNILRPLLVFSRKEVEAFAKAGKIEWREDSSNKTDNYLRNKIRHKVIPFLKAENPELIQNFLKTQEHLHEASVLVEAYIKRLSDEIIMENDGNLVLEIQKINEQPNPKAVLYQLLKAYGFTEWENLCDLLSAQSGKQVFSETHRLVKDREILILTKRNQIHGTIIIEIPEPMEEVVFPEGKLSLETVNAFQKTGNHSIYVDKNKLKFPLKLRKWEQGDSFFPFGMEDRKKVSAFFKDEKFSLPEKERTWLLLSGEKIVWIVGHRADNRFRVDGKTREILKMEHESND